MVSPRNLLFSYLVLNSFPAQNITSVSRDGKSIIQRSSGGIMSVHAIMPNSSVGKEYPHEYVMPLSEEIKQGNFSYTKKGNLKITSFIRENDAKLVRFLKENRGAFRKYINLIIDSFLKKFDTIHHDDVATQKALKIAFTKYMQHVIAYEHPTKKYSEMFKSYFKEKMLAKSIAPEEIDHLLDTLDTQETVDNISKAFPQHNRNLQYTLAYLDKAIIKPTRQGYEFLFTVDEDRNLYSSLPSLSYPIARLTDIHNCYASSCGLNNLWLNSLKEKKKKDYRLLEKMGYQPVTEYSSGSNIHDFLKDKHSYILVLEKNGKLVHVMQYTSYNGEQHFISKNGRFPEAVYFDSGFLEKTYDCKVERLYEIKDEDVPEIPKKFSLAQAQEDWESLKK